jgi:hypothetical protein
MELLFLLFLRWGPKITYKLFSECLGVFLLVKGSHFFQGIFIFFPKENKLILFRKMEIYWRNEVPKLALTVSQLIRRRYWTPV